MRKHLPLFATFLILLTIFFFTVSPVQAAEVVDSGTCGDNLTWTLTADGVLTISGTGEMHSYYSDYPGWYWHADLLTKAVLEEGVTSVGSSAFWGCQQLRQVWLPKTLTYIGGEAFKNCTGLELIVFTGPAPEIVFDACISVDAMAVYPAGDNSWNLTTLDQLAYGDVSWVNGETPTSLYLISPPDDTNLALNENPNLQGIRIRAEFADGSEVILKSGVMKVESCDSSAVGVQTAVVSYQGLTVSFQVYVHESSSVVQIDPADLPESDHDYANNLNDWQTISCPGADSITLTFSDTTRLYEADSLTLYTGTGKVFAVYKEREASGLTVTVPGDTVKLLLYSDEQWTVYGYKVESATAYIVSHIWEETQGQAPDCETDGYTAGSRCKICGCVASGQIIPATGHSYGTWYYGEDKLWHSECAVCGDSRTRDAAAVYSEAGKSSYGQMTIEELRALYATVDWEMQADYVSEPLAEPPYAAGQLTDDCLNNLTAQVNFFRRIARLDPVALDMDLTELAQAGSVVSAANGVLSHYPERPEGMDDALFSLGSTGCRTSNLAIGCSLMQSVPAYMDDSDWTNISKVGHRRWLLAPGLGRVGFGHAFGAAATHICDAEFRGSDGTDFVAWPGGNRIFPAEFMLPHMAWSVSYSDNICLNLSGDTIKVLLTRESDGKQWEFSYGDSADGYFNVDSSNIGYGQAIIFQPNDVDRYEGVYHVLITGIYPASGGKERVIEYSVDFQSLKIHEHTLVLWNQKDPSCTAEGYTGDQLCSECGKLVQTGDTIPALGHSGGFAVCNSPAICDVCGEPYGEKNPYLHFGDTEVKDAVEAGEFTEGYTGDTYCLGCGVLVIEGSVIPATHTHSYGEWKSDASGHWHECACGSIVDKAAHVPGPAATETAPQVCTVCGYELSPVLDVHTHTLTRVDAADAAHDAPGNSEYYACTCGKWFADADGAQEIENHDSVIIPALSFAYGDVNHDGDIKISDAILVMKYRAGNLSEGDTFCERCTNVKGEGSINIQSAILIMKKRANPNMLFPVELQ